MADKHPRDGSIVRSEVGSLVSQSLAAPSSVLATSPAAVGCVMPGIGGGGITTTTMHRYTATSSVEEVHVTHTTVQPSSTSGVPSSAGSARGPRASSRFNFVADTRAPSELQRLEKETLRRRQEFKEKVRQMEYQIAGWTARLANETMEHDRECEDLVQRAVGHPLESAVERIMARIESKLVTPITAARSNDDGDSSEDNESKGTSLPELEAKVSRLDAALLEHVHKSTYDARVNHLESVRVKLREEAYPLLRLEAAKADKREGGMVRTFEGIAASSAHAMAEENAARVAGLELLKEGVQSEMNEKTKRDEKRVGEFVEEIRRMKESLEEERGERQKADERVLEQIIKTREILQRTVLESLGDA